MATRRRALSAFTALASLGFLRPAPAWADDSLDRVRRAGVINVGTEAAYVPYEFMKDGKIVGYDKDLLDYVMSGLKDVRLNQVDTPYTGLLPALLAGKFDLICTATSMYPELAGKFAFSTPVAEGSTSILARKGDNRIKGPNDLSGKSVSVQLGSGGERALRALDAQLTAAGKPGIDIKPFNSSPEAYLALANGLTDAGVNNSVQLRTVMAAQPGVFQLVGPLTGVKLYVGWMMRRDEQSLRDFVNSKLRELYHNRQIYALQQKWFGFEMELPEKGYLPPGAA